MTEQKIKISLKVGDVIQVRYETDDDKDGLGYAVFAGWPVQVVDDLATLEEEEVLIHWLHSLDDLLAIHSDPVEKREKKATLDRIAFQATDYATDETMVTVPFWTIQKVDNSIQPRFIMRLDETVHRIQDNMDIPDPTASGHPRTTTCDWPDRTAFARQSALDEKDLQTYLDADPKKRIQTRLGRHLLDVLRNSVFFNGENNWKGSSLVYEALWSKPSDLKGLVKMASMDKPEGELVPSGRQWDKFVGIPKGTKGKCSFCQKARGISHQITYGKEEWFAGPTCADRARHMQSMAHAVYDLLTWNDRVNKSRANYQDRLRDWSERLYRHVRVFNPIPTYRVEWYNPKENNDDIHDSESTKDHPPTTSGVAMTSSRTEKKVDIELEKPDHPHKRLRRIIDDGENETIPTHTTPKRNTSTVPTEKKTNTDTTPKRNTSVPTETKTKTATGASDAPSVAPSNAQSNAPSSVPTAVRPESSISPVRRPWSFTDAFNSVMSTVLDPYQPKSREHGPRMPQFIPLTNPLTIPEHLVKDPAPSLVNDPALPRVNDPAPPRVNDPAPPRLPVSGLRSQVVPMETDWPQLDPNASLEMQRSTLKRKRELLERLQTQRDREEIMRENADLDKQFENWNRK